MEILREAAPVVEAAATVGALLLALWQARRPARRRQPAFRKAGRR